jgi:DNA-binding beta-propeller fold protein YncE
MPRVLVANALDSTLGFYDATTRKPLKSLKVGKSPHGIAVGRNRKFGFVANTGDDSLSVVDVIRMTETSRLNPKGLREPAGVVALADGRRLLVTSKTHPEAYVVDTGRNGEVKTIELPGPACESMAPIQGGKVVYLAIPEKRALVAVDTTAGEVTSEHGFPGAPAGVGLARDQRSLLVTVRDPPRLFVFDPSMGMTVSEIEVGPGPSLVKTHPYRNAAFVLVAHGVQPVDLETASVAPPIPVGVKPNAFDLARAGKVLYVASSEGNTLAVVEAEKRNIRDTWETGHHPTAVLFIA